MLRALLGANSLRLEVPAWQRDLLALTPEWVASYLVPLYSGEQSTRRGGGGGSRTEPCRLMSPRAHSFDPAPVSESLIDREWRWACPLPPPPLQTALREQAPRSGALWTPWPTCAKPPACSSQAGQGAASPGQGAAAAARPGSTAAETARPRTGRGTSASAWRSRRRPRRRRRRRRQQQSQRLRLRRCRHPQRRRAPPAAAGAAPPALSGVAGAAARRRPRCTSARPANSCGTAAATARPHTGRCTSRRAERRRRSYRRGYAWTLFVDR